jgi:hypothetical protein
VAAQLSSENVLDFMQGRYTAILGNLLRRDAPLIGMEY